MNYPVTVTVLMPVYNGEKYLGEAIESILSQSFTDFEFLIINDGSTDRTEEIILNYSDQRIRYVKNNMNSRLIANLNKGIQLAQGKYIVRMDADDVSMPQRIAEQVAYMETHPEITVAGSWITKIPSGNKIKFETNPTLLKTLLLFSCHLNHPSVIIRTDFLRNHQLAYNPDALHAEDYALWLDIYKAGGQIGIVPSYLLNYRTHDANIGVKHADVQKIATLNFREKNLLQLVDRIDQETFRLFNHFITVANNEYFDFTDPSLFVKGSDFKTLATFLLKLIAANQTKKVIEPQEQFSRFIAQKWLLFCQQNSAKGLAAYQSFFCRNFQSYTDYSGKDRIRFLVKSLFHQPL